MGHSSKRPRPPVSPSLSPTEFPSLSVEAAQSGEHYEAVKLCDVTATDLELPSTVFADCSFVRWNVGEANFRATRLSEVQGEDLAIASLSAVRSTWNRVEISSSRLGAVEAYESELRRVVIRSSKVDWMNLRRSDLSDVAFEDCTLEELDLSGSKIARVAFKNVNVRRLCLTNVKAENFDLRGLDMQTIEGLEGLRGAVLTSFQVATMSQLFASHLGISVRD